MSQQSVTWQFNPTRCEFCGEILREDDPYGGLCEGCVQDWDEPASDPMGYSDCDPTDPYCDYCEQQGHSFRACMRRDDSEDQS